MSNALELLKVTKCYGKFTAVSNLSLSVEQGCVYGFLGPNGAGKTTTIRMILDILRPTNGTIRVLGEDVIAKVRQRLGYLPEEKGLYKKMGTAAFIAYFGMLKGMNSKLAKTRAVELLERYGLKEFANHRTEALSKGMGQKVQVLATIVHNPELVILDEPFSGLDPVNQTVMEEIIGDLKARGRTVIFSTHVMQHAERLCDRIVVIARGERLFDGKLAEARQLMPRRVQLAGDGDWELLRSVSGVVEIYAVGENRVEVEVRDGVDPQLLLRACFERGIILREFRSTEPTLHDVFVKLVSPTEGGAGGLRPTEDGAKPAER